jgi:hypothetical protein
MSDWTWVWLAWSQLVIAYGAYLVYLSWRANKVKDEE